MNSNSKMSARIISPLCLVSLMFCCVVISSKTFALLTVEIGPYKSSVNAKKDAENIADLYSNPVVVSRSRGKFTVYILELESKQTASDAVISLRGIGYGNTRLATTEINIKKLRIVYRFNQGSQNSVVQQSTTNTTRKQVVEFEESPTPLFNYQALPEVISSPWAKIAFEQYQEACDEFERIDIPKEYRSQAYFGIVKCSYQISDFETAKEKLNWLIRNEFRLLDTIPVMIQIMEKEQNELLYDFYQKLLIDAKRSEGILEEETKARTVGIQRAIKDGDRTRLASLLRLHKSALEQCETPGDFLSASRYYRKIKKNGEAQKILMQLLESCEKKWSLRLGVLYDLSKISSMALIESLAREELSQEINDEYRQKVHQLLIDYYMVKIEDKNLDKNGSGEEDLMPLYNKILAINESYEPALYSLAWYQYNRGKFRISLEQFDQLIISSVKENKDRYLEGKLFALMALNRFAEAKEIALDINRNELWLLAAEQQLLEAEEEDKQEIAESILGIDSQNIAALSYLAWHQFNADLFQASNLKFDTLISLEGPSSKACEGFLLSNLKLGEYNRFESGLNRCELDRVEWTDRLNLHRAQLAFNNESYLRSTLWLIKIKRPTPESQELAAWLDFRTGEYELSRFKFRKLVNNHPSQSRYEGLLASLQALKLNDEWQSVMDELTKSDVEEFRQIAGETIGGDHPYFSSQLNPNGIFKNWHTAYVDVDLAGLQKTGTPGLDALENTRVNFAYHSEWFQEHWQWHYWHQQMQLDTTDQLSSRVGQYYLPSSQATEPPYRYQQNVNSLGISYRSWFSQFQLQMGQVRKSLDHKYILGVLYRSQSLEFEYRRAPYFQTMLSINGLVDPYTNTVWGPVEEDYLRASYRGAFSESYWYSSNLRGHKFDGKRVKENQALGLDLFLGEQYESGLDSINWAVFLSIDQYDATQTGAAFSRGGYYSPFESIKLGPIYSRLHQSSPDFFWHLKVQLNLYQDQEKSNDLYPLLSRSEETESSTESGIAATVNWEISKLFDRQFEVSMGVNWQQSPTFRQSEIVLQLKYFFAERNSIAPESERLSVFSERVNRPQIRQLLKFQ